MLDIASRFEPAVRVRGRALAATGLLVALVALPIAFVPSLARPALVLGGVAFLVSGIALVGALGGRRSGRNLAATGAALGALAGVVVLGVQATYAPGLPAREITPGVVVPAVGLQLPDVTVSVGRWTKAGVPVTVTNKADRLRSVDLTVEAVGPKGRRIATDTVSASLVPPGGTSTVHAFTGDGLASRPGAVEPGLTEQLRGATFRLIEAAQFA